VATVTQGEKVEEEAEKGTEQQHVANGDEAKAEVAAEVADTAQKLDDEAVA